MTSAITKPAAVKNIMTGRAGGLIKLIIGLAALAEVVAIGLWFLPGKQVGDMDVYDRIGLSAAANFGTVRSEYPPAVSSIFVALKVAAPHADFTHVWVTFVISVLALAYFFCLWRLRPSAHLLPLGALASVGLLGAEVTLLRYDILVMVFLFLAWQMFREKRSFGGALFLAAAASLKLVPAVIFPVVFMAASRTEWKKLAGGALAGILLSFSAALLLLGGHGTISNIIYMFGYHGERGIEIESLWSSIDLLWRNLNEQRVLLGFHHSATHNEDLNHAFSGATGLAALLGIVVIYLHLWKHRPRTIDDSVGYWFLLLLWITAVAPVFSPQYLIWSLPLILMWILDRMIVGGGSKRSLPLVLIALVSVAIALMTQWIFPDHFFSLNKQPPLIVVEVLMTRNLAMFVLIWLLGRQIQALAVGTADGNAG